MTPAIHNKKNYTRFRQELRNTLTPAEAELWKYLQNGNLENRKFRRQHSVGNFNLDFYCPQEKLGIELDGAGHFTEEGIEADDKRTHYLNSLNIKILRFENEEVFRRLEEVLEEIKGNLPPLPLLNLPPLPPKIGGESG